MRPIHTPVALGLWLLLAGCNRSESTGDQRTSSNPTGEAAAAPEGTVPQVTANVLAPTPHPGAALKAVPTGEPAAKAKTAEPSRGLADKQRGKEPAAKKRIHTASDESKQGQALPSQETPAPSTGAGADSAKAKLEATQADKPPKKVQSFRGKVVGKGPFSAWLEGTGPYEVGKPATARAIVTAKPPYKCNSEYPYKFSLDMPPRGVTYGSAVVKGGHIGPKRSVLTIPFTPQEAGLIELSGTLRFSVCTDDRCLVEKEHLRIELQVD